MRALAAGTALAAFVHGCGSESPLVAGSSDSYDFTARVRHAIPLGATEANAGEALRAQGFDCAHTDTLQSDEGDTLQSHSAPDDPGTEYLTCDFVRRRRWGENTRRRYLVVLYIREQRVERIFAVTHLREVH
ncbi:MAG: hypothetical protein M3Y30_11865 [Gemmatimonadota bacterium]|nr:hypothetical protein [Gemmatimonadota bacterium]